MSTGLLVVAVVTIWVLVGIVAVLVLLGRQGYRDPTWYLIGAVLGPIIVPLALERARRETRVLERAPTSSEQGGGLTVLIGVDGSAGCEQAVHAACRLLAGTGGRAVLVTAIDPDSAEFHRDEAIAGTLLDRRAEPLRELGVPTVLEVACGRPARVLLDVADAEDADVVVVGRRGRGMSHHLLGSVADHLLRHSPRPVLLAAPVRPGHTEPVATTRAARP